MVLASPIQPEWVLKTISNQSNVSPAFNTPQGVALEIASEVGKQIVAGGKKWFISVGKSVIIPANEISKKHLAASAGFIKF